MLFPSITLSDRFPFLQRCALLDAQGPFPLPLPLQRPILFSLWLDDQFCLPSGFRFLKPGRRPFQVWGLEEFAQGPQKAGKLQHQLFNELLKDVTKIEDVPLEKAKALLQIR